MKKSDVEKALFDYAQTPFLSKKQITDLLGYKQVRATDYLLVGMVKVGNRYFYKDVAERIMERGIK